MIKSMSPLQDFINLPVEHQIDNRSLAVEIYRKVEEIIITLNEIEEWQLAICNSNNTKLLTNPNG